jgi:hypothetical protein
MAIKDITPGEPAGSGSRLSLNRVLKKMETAGTTPGACASFRQPVIPPAPLTGDVGRDRGDAGRALLFYIDIIDEFLSANFYSLLSSLP